MIIVTNTNDSGAGSLRQAIIDAAVGEEITFSVSGTIILTTGDLDITDDLIITGPGSGSLAIDGNVTSRIFNVTGGVVSISGLKLQNGVDADGGGIHNETTLSLSDIVVDSCSSSTDGGGIWNSSTITAENVTVSNNVATLTGAGLYNNGTASWDGGAITSNAAVNEGGGVWNDGTATLTDVQISGNSSDTAAGGGAFNAGTLTLVECAVFSNTTVTGEGMAIKNSSTTLNITRSTVSNHVQSSSTAIDNDFGTVVIANSTISTNTMGVLNNVGAVGFSNCTVVLNTTGIGQASGSIGQFYDTILAGNTLDYDGDTADAISLGHNIFGVNTNPITTTTGDLSILTFGGLVMGPLQNNGGPTNTHALLTGSPAINTGDNTGAPATDQRGEPRIQEGTIDIGAYESVVVVPPEPPIPPVPPIPTTTGLRGCPTPQGDCGFLGVRADDASPGIPNLSAEAPDEDISIFLPYPPPWIKPPLGGGGGSLPGDGTNVVTKPVVNDDIPTGDQPCVKQVFGQFGAMLSGQIPATCSPAVPPTGPINPAWPIPPSNPYVPNTPRPTYPNDTQTASATCPDGSILSYTIRAGTYFMQSLAIANATALSAAKKIVTMNLACFIGSFDACCVTAACASTITISGNPRLFTWQLTSGSLPDGMVMQSLNGGMALLVSGFPTTAGVYTFGLRAVDRQGLIQSKLFTMSVLEISTNLPDPEVGVAYSQQLAATGSQGSSVWALVSGLLPTGLTLSEEGLLAGTPTEEALFSFTVAVTNSGGTCTREYFLDVQPTAVCPVFFTNYTTAPSGDSLVYVPSTNRVWVGLNTLFPNIGINAYIPSTGALDFANTASGNVETMVYATTPNVVWGTVFNAGVPQFELHTFNPANGNDLGVMDIDAILLQFYNPTLNHVYSSSSAAGGLRVYNATSGATQYDIVTPSTPGIPAYVPATNQLWLGIDGTGINTYNATTGAFILTIPTDPGLDFYGSVYHAATNQVITAFLDGAQCRIMFLDQDDMTETSINISGDAFFDRRYTMFLSPNTGLIYVQVSSPALGYCVIKPSTRTELCFIAATNSSVGNAFDTILERSWLAAPGAADVYQE